MSEPGSREQVLVVDDDPCNLDMVSTHLSAAGYQPLVADNGLKALAILEQDHPRIVISDWLMPKMDGLEVCRLIRQSEADRMLYFIMLTVHSDKDRMMEAFDVGVDDFLSKPFHQGELLARVRAGARMIRMYDELSTRTQALIRSNGELHTLNERLHQSVIIDDLTKLFNRRQAMLRLKEQWTISRRYSQPFACAVIDIDYFKRVNDTYGHLKGDEVLQKVGGVLTQCVRTADSVYRIGGEEFLILFPQSSAEQASVSAERCRSAVESSIFVGDDRITPVTISVGIAECQADMRCPDDLLKAADAAMYAAKRQGRNRMMVSLPAA